MYDSWYIIYLWCIHPRCICTCGMYIPGIFIFIPEGTHPQAFQNTLPPSYELLGAHQYIPHSTSRPMTGNPINSTTNVLCIGGLSGFSSEVPSGATGCRGIPPCGMLRAPGTSHVGSRGFPRYPRLYLVGYRGNTAVSHGISHGISRDVAGGNGNSRANTAGTLRGDPGDHVGCHALRVRDGVIVIAGTRRNSSKKQSEPSWVSREYRGTTPEFAGIRGGKQDHSRDNTGTRPPTWEPADIPYDLVVSRGTTCNVGSSSALGKLQPSRLQWKIMLRMV